MAKLPMNVVNFAAQTNADSALVYELFQDYFCHYMAETQKRNIGAYDTSVILTEKESKMHKTLLSEVQRLSGAEITEENAKMMAKNPMVKWATFAVVEAMIDAILPLTLIDSIGTYTEIRNIGFGDSASFEIAPRSLMTVSQGAKNDIISVLSKYVDIDTKELDFNITKAPSDGGELTPALCANIPIKGVKRAANNDKVSKE